MAEKQQQQSAEEEWESVGRTHPTPDVDEPPAEGDPERGRGRPTPNVDQPPDESPETPGTVTRSSESADRREAASEHVPSQGGTKETPREEQPHHGQTGGMGAEANTTERGHFGEEPPPGPGEEQGETGQP